MVWSGSEVATVSVVILILVFGLILFQEAVNGFHDVANAIATVIYSNALRPGSAVVLAAVCNFLGVLGAGSAVAFSLVYLLPMEMVAGIDTTGEAALFFAMIVAAVIWNFGTWWLAIPNSTTHAYVGSILGISIANAVVLGKPVGDQIHWHQGEVILAALLLSPVVGVVLGLVLLLLLTRLVKDPQMFKPAEAHHRPARSVRAVLVAGSAGVSLLHGSNDGQKSIGLMMIVLFGLAPAVYGLDPARLNADDHATLRQAVTQVQSVARSTGVAPMLEAATALDSDLAQSPPVAGMSDVDATETRENILRLHTAISKVTDDQNYMKQLPVEQRDQLSQASEVLKDLIEHVPFWVVLLSALALGGGTAIGYQKIVTTLGEGMGSARISPAQGTAAQVSAVISIAMADGGGLPVSTTHVLSSAVIGTVAGTPGQRINRSMLAKIMMTWVTTLPGTMLLSFALGMVFYFAFA